MSASMQPEVVNLANEFRRYIQQRTVNANEAGDVANLLLVGFLLDIHNGDTNQAARHMERLSVQVAKSLRRGDYKQR